MNTTAAFGLQAQARGSANAPARPSSGITTSVSTQIYRTRAAYASASAWPARGEAPCSRVPSSARCAERAHARLILHEQDQSRLRGAADRDPFVPGPGAVNSRRTAGESRAGTSCPRPTVLVHVESRRRTASRSRTPSRDRGPVPLPGLLSWVKNARRCCSRTSSRNARSRCPPRPASRRPSSRAHSRITIRPPRGIASRALTTRLMITCSSCPRSDEHPPMGADCARSIAQRDVLADQAPQHRRDVLDHAHRHPAPSAAAPACGLKASEAAA